ncbi:MAG: bifunctional 4-hydroxy-2-oxoglutarate aldolase/2-dehydro-3-deoxy-phosphogluconate aldolase [Oscillatoriales cyanobacterium RM2_1_1]|nr:bifunctional 4-hydroxy-2-oxoglutarate aldolase/2-dehydro-3-deoxy-phosphogluconate aldolase [Oscillatoriales cyanobacterium SM2_3_0]NJO44381.1 bifunctional 4-hydroxy-2-oxoglutarate aldolase/2-dehydro-3-deoxy-phosphogluconate aldolase [Oscillatoriales cyanobacterium RM2_1_1]
MNNSSWLKQLHQHRAIAVIRTPVLEIGWQMANAVWQGGIRLIEITWNSDCPGSLVSQLRTDFPDCWIGAGTLLTLDQMEQAIASGAQFLVSPHTNPGLIQRANQAGIPVIPGAFSPTEIVTAWQAGADCVKVFPIATLGGATYIKNLQGPLGQIPLIPTGGVTFENTQALIESGAVAVGLAGDFFPKFLMETQAWSTITQRTQQFTQKLLYRS